MNRDVVIVGAGPAGSASALMLARRGWAVTLIEQSRFPRGKVCGECLSATAIESLKRMSLHDAVLDLHPAVLSYAAIHSPRGKSLQLPLPKPMWGISRHALDGFLLDAARDAGAEVLQPARCEGIESGTPARVRVRRLEGNVLEVLSATHVIVADGKSALMGGAPAPTRDFGIKTHFEGVHGPTDTIDLFGCDGLYGGLAAIEGHRWNAAFSVPAQRLRAHRGNVDAVFEQIVRENSVLGRRLLGARRVSEWLAAPLPRFPVRDNWGAQLVPIGNAAAAIEPIGGEGMGLALRSAEILVSALVGSAVGGDYDVAKVRREFRRLWRYRRPFCRLSANVISRPSLAEVALPAVHHFPAVGSFLLGLMGK